jgi:LysM repeat protein
MFASRRRVVATLALVVSLAGCGSDNATSRPPTTPLPTVPDDAGDISDTTTTVPSVYIVKAGESLTTIANKFGITVAALVAFNELADPNHIEEGQRLKIPSPVVTDTTTTDVAP